MPMLLALGQWFSLLSGALFLLFMVLAPFDLGSFSINGEGMSGPEFLRRGGWVMGIDGALLLGVAVGLLKERSWARPLMILHWIAIIGLTLAAARDDIASGVISAVMQLAFLAVAVWYLYQKENVRAYFESRAARSVDA